MLSPVLLPTRTRMAFDMAAKRLSADVISLEGSSSSTTKGETLRDTAQNIEALQADMLIIRHAAAPPWPVPAEPGRGTRTLEATVARVRTVIQSVDATLQGQAAG